jgi:hypothetical protein
VALSYTTTVVGGASEEAEDEGDMALAVPEVGLMRGDVETMPDAVPEMEERGVD